MSSLIVEVCEVNDVTEHDNADSLELVHVKGWQVCAQVGQHAKGSVVVYVPPDAVLPEQLSDAIGVTQYCSPAFPKNADGTRDPGMRVKVAKLRGQPSYGLLMPIPDGNEWGVGTDVAKYYGITKYEPPPRPATGDIVADEAGFEHYWELSWAVNPTS